MVVKLRNNTVELQSQYKPSLHTKFRGNRNTSFALQHHRPIESRSVDTLRAREIFGRKEKQVMSWGVRPSKLMTVPMVQDEAYQTAAIVAIILLSLHTARLRG